MEFVTLPDKPTPDATRLNLIGLIKQGLKIDIGERPLAAIKDIEKELIENNYSVMFIQIPGKTAHAHFFLERKLHAPA